jgi:hypothetical protein
MENGDRMRQQERQLFRLRGQTGTCSSFNAPRTDLLTALSLWCASSNQTASVDLSPLGSGRPRDLTSCPPHAAAVTDPDMRAVVQTETECLVIATSQGQVLVLSANRLEQLGLQVRRGPCGVLRYYKNFSVSIIVSHYNADDVASGARSI